jgi:aspartokinase
MEVISKGMEEFGITGVSADKSKALIEIELARPTVMNAVWDGAANQHLMVVSPVFIDGKILFFGESDAEGEWNKLLGKLSLDGFVRSYRINSDLVPVSVIGERFSQDGLALQQIVETLASEHISVTIGAASALAAAVAVSKSKVDDAVQVLHDRFLSG